MHRWSCFAGVLMAAGLPAVAMAGEAKCPGGWFSVQAIVMHISPADAEVLQRSAHSSPTRIAVNTMLCEGDTILFPKPNEATVVELYRTGEMVLVESSKGAYTIRGGTRDVSRAVRAYLDAAMDAVVNLDAPPPRTSPTASRGNLTSSPAEEPIRTILPLRTLPRQLIAADTHPVVGWRGGMAPYACHALNESSEVIWTQGDVVAGWCEFATTLLGAARIVVRDATGRSVGWNVAIVGWSNVPRPDWVPANASGLSAADVTAWAVWIWQTAGPEWRLQSLGMLNTAARTEWFANYFVDSVLAEAPPLRPR